MMVRSYCIIVLFLVLPLNCREKNSTIVFDIRDKSNAVMRYVALVLFSLFLLYGIAVNALMVAVIYGRNSYYSRAFILIVSQLIICNSAIFLLQVAYVLPAMLKTESNLGECDVTWIRVIIANINTFSFFGYLQFTFLLAVNRFVALILPKFNALFESKLPFLLGFLWLLAIAITVAYSYYCTSRYCISTLIWKTNCTKRSEESGKNFKRYYRLWKMSLPIAMFVIYIAIFCNIRRKRHFTSDINHNQGISRFFARHKTNITTTSNYERSMLIQAALTCIFLEIEMIVFKFCSKLVVKIFGEGAYISSRIFINSFIIINSAVLPTIHFIYSKRARNIIKQQFSRLFFKDKFVINTTTVQINDA
ncbi:putative integral membrane protein [Acanthocheilonema viteae]